MFTCSWFSLLWSSKHLVSIAQWLCILISSYHQLHRHLLGQGEQKRASKTSFSLFISHITLSSLLFSLSLVTIVLWLCHGNWFFKIHFCSLSRAVQHCWFTSTQHLCPVWDLAFKVLPHCHISAINLNIQEQQPKKNVPALNNLHLLICCLHLLLFFFFFFFMTFFCAWLLAICFLVAFGVLWGCNKFELTN